MRTLTVQNLTVNGTFFNVTTTTININSSGNINTTGYIQATDFTIPSMYLNGNYSTLNDFFRLFTSAGRITGGEISDAGSENVYVAGGSGIVRIADDDVSQVKFFEWSGDTIAVTTDTVLYIKVDYNGGSPIVTSTLTSDDWDLDTSFPLGKIVNEGGTLHILNNPWWIGDGLTNVIERFQSEGMLVRDIRQGGFVLSVPGTRNIAVTGGTIWSRLSEFEY